MPTPCITGSYVDRMREAIVMSEKQRVRVTELGKLIGNDARTELMERYRLKRVAPPDEAMLATVADEAIGKDARWKVAVADEQWGWRLTMMYALAEITTSMREHTQILDLIHQEAQKSLRLQQLQLEEQRTTNELLRRLVREHTPARPNPTPAQREGE